MKWESGKDKKQESYHYFSLEVLDGLSSLDVLVVLYANLQLDIEHTIVLVLFTVDSVELVHQAPLIFDWRLEVGVGEIASIINLHVIIDFLSASLDIRAAPIAVLIYMFHHHVIRNLLTPDYLTMTGGCYHLHLPFNVKV